ncbi:MAG: sulfite oxidase [Gemmatimonadota bacterium]
MHDLNDEPSWDDLRGMLEDADADPQDVERLGLVVSRRRLLGLAGGTAALLTGIGAGRGTVMKGLFRRGMIPIAWADEADGAAPRTVDGSTDAGARVGRAQETGQEAEIPGKPGMIVHNTRPVNGEFPPHLLDDPVTPTERHFVRNNGLVPERAERRDPQGWSLTVDGEVRSELRLSLADLRAMPGVTLRLVIECGGNGRALFDPPVRGNPWGRGAVACSEWTGVRLRDVLNRAGLRESAVYTAHYGEDPQLGTEPPFSRGVPLDKAMEEHTLIAYAMNGEDLAPLNGYPVRLVVPGWIGSCSQKWLTRIWVRDRQHDSKKMTGYSYRVPAYPVPPGTVPPESEMVVATSWIIKSLITHPAADSRLATGERVPVAGHAWAGEREVARVLVSTDYGITWEEVTLADPPNRYAWQRWETEVSFGRRGYYEIWARAFDRDGSGQPLRQPWNPKGYLGNVVHRVPVLVEA